MPCTCLVIDPGCSSSILDVQKAHQAGIILRKKSKLVIQLANGELKTPVGEMVEKEPINVGGVKVRLRMPVMDAKGSYDILLGRDWLHAVNAIGNYRKNTYVISKDGREVMLSGKMYTVEEVELPQDIISSEEDYDGSASESDDDEESNIILAYLAQCFALDEFDVRVSLSQIAQVPAFLDNPVLEMTLTNFQDGEEEKEENDCSMNTKVIKAAKMEVEQLETMDINSTLNKEQTQQV